MIIHNQLITRGNSISRIYGSYLLVHNDLQSYNELVNNLKKTEIKIVENNSNIKNIILIIGESTSRNHMSLYDYKLPTNPLLQNLEKSDNLFKFTNVISPHTQTILVLKKLFTYTNYEADFDWSDSDNLIDIFKSANYHTLWFSNQESLGIWGNVAAAFASRCDNKFFTSNINSRDITNFNKFDQQLIPHIKFNQTDKNFTVIHLMGSHASYSARYPNNFDVFKPEQYQGRFAEIKAQYDNTVLYNDFVINEIFEKVKDEEALIIYLSDHAEEVYNFRNFHGHTETNASIYMLEIPFLIIATDKFKEKFPNTIKSIKESTHLPYMTDDAIHTILDLASIKTQQFDPTRSIINPKFNSKRPRLFLEKDYDTFWKEHIIQTTIIDE